jgi:Spy/CpxP family protein refolding chaperone
MKTKLLILSIFTLFVGTVSMAQDIKDELEIIQKIWGKNKKALTQDLLKLTPEEAAKFAPIYDGYLESRRKVSQVRAEAIQVMAKTNAEVDDATAKSMVSNLMKANNTLSKLQSKTFKQLSKALSPIKAAQWWQLESYLDSEIRAAILSEIPMLQSVKK